MKLVVLTLVVLIGVSAGGWCSKNRAFYSGFHRPGTAFENVDAAKAACDGDDGCGGVSIDRIPYREDAGGPAKYPQTIYLLSSSNVQKNPRGSWRYNAYVKC
ncbi:hypothetical protein ACHWQZ_G007396 [Mnemiopsis leidyi]